MSERFNVVVSDELYERLEQARGDVSRSKFTQRALEEKLALMPLLPRVAEQKVAAVRAGSSSRPAHLPTCTCATCKAENAAKAGKR